MMQIFPAVFSRFFRRPLSLKKHMVFTVWLLLWVVAICTHAQTMQGGGESLQLRGAHPYLFFTAEDVARLKERIEKEKSATEAWSKILESATRAVEQGETGGGPGRGGRGGGMEQLCLAYRMTGEKKFAEKIKQMLQAQMQRKDFSEPYLLERDPPWHSGLQTGEACYNFAIGYDCIHDFLSPEERKDDGRRSGRKGH